MDNPEREDQGTVSYLLGSERRTIPVTTYLQHCWSGGLDSACMICGRDFAPPNEPPIRTFTQDIDSALGTEDHADIPTSRLVLRFFNRHLDCIRKRMQFVPVSHVWHEAVAIAHTSRLTNDDAEKIIMEVPWKTALAARRAYGNGVEVWHDYISIPQWQPDIQQRLLLQLPSLFSWAQSCLIHLEEVSSESVEAVLERNSKGEGPHRTLEDKHRGIHQFTNAQWHKRMWCALEYTHCNFPRLLTQDYEVVANDPKQRASFDQFAESCNTGLKQIFDTIGVRRAADNGYGHIFFLRRRASLSFGDVFNLVSTTECRDPRDKFLAMAGLLSTAPYHILCQRLADRSIEDTCRWVWTMVMERGDYGPLLLKRTNAFTLEDAKWVSDCHDLIPSRWGIGSLANLPSFPVWLSSYPILRLRLESVGKIEQFIFRAGHMDTFLQIFDLVLDCPSSRTPQGFFAAMLRVFAVPYHQTLPDHFPMKFEVFERLIPRFARELEILITEYVTNAADERKRLDTLEKLIALLRLASLTSSKEMISLSALDYFRWHWTTYYEAAIAVIRCYGCRNTFPYRLDVLGDSPHTAEVYRIPGLQYWSTARNGVGIVVSNKRIIGRMTHGTPACDCNRLVEVELA